MPNQKFTTIRVYEKDKDLLLQKYDGAAYEAFHRIVTKTCTHPEDQRTYVIAELPVEGEEALTQDGERRQLGGFFCGICRVYVFRPAGLLPTGS